MRGYGKREWAARALVGMGAASLIRRLSSQRPRIDILAYHRVWDMGEEDAFPFDPELISATPRDFRWQMEHVLRVGTPITSSRLAESLDQGSDLPPRPILVTFDDGHRDNFTHAFPVLRELGVPATVFLSTGYLGSKATFWFDRVAHLVFRAPPGRLHVSALDFEADLQKDVATRRGATGRLLEALKAVPDPRRRRALGELEEQLAGNTVPGDDALSGALTWEEVETMARGGIEFGSHTVSHPILTQLGDGPLAEELTSSRLAIEERVGCRVTTLAYPVGGKNDFDDRVVAATRRAGYRVGVSYLPGTNRRGQDRFRFRRLHVERYTSRARFQAMLALPELFA